MPECNELFDILPVWVSIMTFVIGFLFGYVIHQQKSAMFRRHHSNRKRRRSSDSSSHQKVEINEELSNEK